MSFSKEALELLQEKIDFTDIAKQLEFTGVNTPIAVIPDNMSITDLSEFSDKLPKLNLRYKTSNIDSYVEYLRENNLGFFQSTCFIDDSGTSAVTIFDLGTNKYPLHKRHTAVLNLDTEPFHDALMNMTEREGRTTQKDLLDFLEEWQEYLFPIDKDGNKLNIRSVISALSDFSIDEMKNASFRKDFASESSASMNSIEAKSKETLPYRLACNHSSHTGLEKVNFLVNIIYLLNDEKPYFKLRIVQKNEIIKRISELFRSQLIELAEEKDETSNSLVDMKFYIGSWDR